MKRHLLLLLGLVACSPAAQTPQPALHPAPGKPNVSVTEPDLVGTALRVPDAGINIILNEAFWQGELLPFGGPGTDRGTLRRAAESLSVRQQGRDYVLLPLEVQRVSGAGGLYLVVFGGAPTHVEDSAFLGHNVALIRLGHADGVTTAVTVDARLGRPPAATQPGRSQRFRLEAGKLLELE